MLTIETVEKIKRSTSRIYKASQLFPEVVVDRHYHKNVMYYTRGEKKKIDSLIIDKKYIV